MNSKNKFNDNFVNYQTSPIHSQGVTIHLLNKYFRDFHFKRIADIGCGTGYAGYSLLKFTDQISFIDPSVNMLNKVRELLGAENIHKAIFFQNNAENLKNSEHGNYDLMISRMALHHFENVPIAIENMFRCLNERGILILSDLYSSKNNRLFNISQNIEILHDKTHGKNYSDKEILKMIGNNCNGYTVLKNESVLESERGITVDFWCSITNTSEGDCEKIKEILKSLNDEELNELGYSKLDGELVNHVKTTLLIVKID